MESDATAGSGQQDANAKYIRPSIWLSLSGGGFRAAIFHYGCLKRLHELGLLGHVYAISATSGGAIIAALLSRYRGNFYRDKDRGVLIEQYEWEAFEKHFLNLVQRGVIAPVFMLVLAYICYGLALIFLMSPFEFPSRQLLAFMSGGMGFGLHLALAYQLLAEGAHKASETAQGWAKLDDRFTAAEWTRSSYLRWLRMLLVPSYLRWQLLNLRAYEGELLTSLITEPKIFLTAVDLNTGKEVVFTSGQIANLGLTGAGRLWEQQPQDAAGRSDNVELAQAVQASSAIPPFFRPVSIRNTRGLVGVFVDGGVLDNFALNVAKAMAVSIHPRRSSRYGRAESKYLAFKEHTSFILTADAGKSPVVKQRSRWGRLRCALRLMNVLVDQQTDAAGMASLDLDWVAGIQTTMVGLQPGLPPGGEFGAFAEEIGRSVSRIRTHLDGFSREECAVLAYCGYRWTDELVRGRPSHFSRYEKATWVDAKPLNEILPADAGAWDPSPEQLLRHLRYSNRRLKVLRELGRRFNI